MRVADLALSFALAVLLGAPPALAQEAQEDQDPVDLDWSPAWDTPFWPAPGGAALEIAAGHTGRPVSPGAPSAFRSASGDYLLALLTLPLGARARSERSDASDGAPSSAPDDGQSERSLAPKSGVLAQHGARPASPAVPPPAVSREPMPPANQESHPAPHEDQAAPTASAPRPLPGRVQVSLELLRTAIDRAERSAGFESALGRLSSIGRRSRWSGLAPELRLRGATGIDQTRSIDSTGVVPGDETLRDASDSLVEVRLTFHLERLLHSGQEVALEKARQQVLADRIELRALVGQELVTYVRSLARLGAEELEDDEREKLELSAERARLSLYLLTEGWFLGEETVSRYEPRTHEREPPRPGSEKR